MDYFIEPYICDCPHPQLEKELLNMEDNTLSYWCITCGSICPRYNRSDEAMTTLLNGQRTYLSLNEEKAKNYPEDRSTIRQLLKYERDEYVDDEDDYMGDPESII